MRVALQYVFALVFVMVSWTSALTKSNILTHKRLLRDTTDTPKPQIANCSTFMPSNNAWNSIDAFCITTSTLDSHNHLVYNIYFVTKNGERFRFCNGYTATINPLNSTVDKSLRTALISTCIKYWIPKCKFREKSLVDGVNNNTTIIKDLHHGLSYRQVCYQRSDLKHSRFRNAPLYTMWLKPQACSPRDNTGYLNLPPSIIGLSGDEIRIANTIDKCEERNYDHDINWNKMQLVCFHFKKYEGKYTTDVYFRAVGDRGTFRHCHGLAAGEKSNCFPRELDRNKWDKWTFPNGAVNGETDLLGLDIDNVHCYSRQNTMGDINGMKNWYKEQPFCKPSDLANFYGYDYYKHGTVTDGLDLY